jgi:hypothetical protein
MRSLCHVTGAPVCNADHAQRRSSTIARDVFAGSRICALPAPLRRSYPLPLPSRYAPEPVPTEPAPRADRAGFAPQPLRAADPELAAVASVVLGARAASSSCCSLSYGNLNSPNRYCAPGEMQIGFGANKKLKQEFSHAGIAARLPRKLLFHETEAHSARSKRQTVLCR